MSRVLPGTPAGDGFRMPAEWARHRGCYLIWPQRPDTWREGGVPAQRAWVTLATALARHEPVTVLASAAQWATAREQLPDAVRVLQGEADDAWVRDTGPTFLVGPRGALRAVDWEFNAWGGLNGGLYHPWDLDAQVAATVADLEQAHRYRPGIVMEGGSFDVDGQGTALVTEECLLNPNRNPQLDRAAIEAVLRSHLGLSRVIWLPRGVYLDETDGHVDNLARFLAPGLVALTWTEDRGDPQYERSAQALEVLSTARDAAGRPLRVVTLHQPGPLHLTAAEAAGIEASAGAWPRPAGARLAASYVNAYLGNGVVLVPVFDDPHDAAALAAYRELCPDREVVAIPGREILLGGGNIHCITQQVPDPRF